MNCLLIAGGNNNTKNHGSGHKIIVPIPVHVTRLSNLSQSQQLDKSSPLNLPSHHLATTSCSVSTTSAVTPAANTRNLVTRGKKKSLFESLRA